MGWEWEHHGAGINKDHVEWEICQQMVCRHGVNTASLSSPTLPSMYWCYFRLLELSMISAIGESPKPTWHVNFQKPDGSSLGRRVGMGLETEIKRYRQIRIITFLYNSQLKSRENQWRKKRNRNQAANSGKLMCNQGRWTLFTMDSQSLTKQTDKHLRETQSQL